jgi:hypothetical protein
MDDFNTPSNKPLKLAVDPPCGSPLSSNAGIRVQTEVGLTP